MSNRDRIMAEQPRGFTGQTELAPLRDLPDYAAEAGMSALLLSVAGGTRLDVDPYAVAKAGNFDRLMFCKMPIICTGPTGFLGIGKATL
jgi:hypothetical protein